MAEHYRVESGRWFTLYHGTLEKMAQAPGEWDAERARLEQVCAVPLKPNAGGSKASVGSSNGSVALERRRQPRLRSALLLSSALGATDWRGRLRGRWIGFGDI